MGHCLGIDIGGANLKIADGRGFALSRQFALWREPELLAPELRTLLELAPPARRLAITMTGELADCFSSRTEGVLAILDAVISVAGGFGVGVYLTDGRLVSLDLAVRTPLLAAASNWHALARYACRHAIGRRLNDHRHHSPY
jgi:uncharacterized hydantoinase/oxoprolinase family protein